jgi:hypothetical protein
MSLISLSHNEPCPRLVGQSVEQLAYYLVIVVVYVSFSSRVAQLWPHMVLWILETRNLHLNLNSQPDTTILKPTTFGVNSVYLREWVNGCRNSYDSIYLSYAYCILPLTPSTPTPKSYACCGKRAFVKCKTMITKISKNFYETMWTHYVTQYLQLLKDMLMWRLGGWKVGWGALLDDNRSVRGVGWGIGVLRLFSVFRYQ